MLGVDAEYFATDKKGLAVPVLDFFDEGTPGAQPVFKDIASDIQPKGYNSYEVPLENAKLTEDGLPFEVPITPSTEVGDLVRRLRRGVQKAWEVAEYNGYLITAAPLVHLDPKYLEHRPELRVLGCSPDMCIHAFLEGESKPHQDPRKTDWRTGGFHVHFSMPDRDMYQVQSLVMACDTILGLADVLIDHSDGAKQRREMYGAAGKFRMQPWGVEYRTPSSAVSVHPELTEAFLELASMLYTSVKLREIDGINLMNDVGFDEVINAINQVNFDMAYHLLLSGLEQFPQRKVGPVDKIYEVAFSGGANHYYGSYTMEGWK